MTAPTCPTCGTSQVRQLKFNSGNPAYFWLDLCLCAEKETEAFIERLYSRRKLARP